MVDEAAAQLPEGDLAADAEYQRLVGEEWESLREIDGAVQAEAERIEIAENSIGSIEADALIWRNPAEASWDVDRNSLNTFPY